MKIANLYKLFLPFLGVIFFSITALAAPQSSPWAETARTWENTAQQLLQLGRESQAADAYFEAGKSWEMAARDFFVSDTAVPSRLDLLENRQFQLQIEVDYLRRAAESWQTAQRLHTLQNNQDQSELSREKVRETLRSLVEREEILEAMTREMDRRRSSLIDQPVTREIQNDLVERWAQVAQSWSKTAVSWDKSAEPGKARIARIKADAARTRIREIDPTLSEEWFTENTIAPEESAGDSVAEAAAPVPSPGPQIAEEDTPARVKIDIPQIPDRKSIPPVWLITSEEEQALSNAVVWRQSAHAWRKTALNQARDGNALAARRAVEKLTESIQKAVEIEDRVRTAYARREAEIFTQLAKALGDKPRSETDILEALDTRDTVAPSFTPAALPGDAIALELPPLPEEKAAERKKRGFFDLEIGGPIPSTLNIRGRKVVDATFSVTTFQNPDPSRPQGKSTSNFDLNQELQVVVTGMVGPPDNDHININIRFDDTDRGVNSVNNRVIDVNYDGARHERSWGTYEFDPQFGDIGVVLSGSEFAFYNKSLFGAKGDLKIDNLNLGPIKADHVRLIAFGSQTKGLSASKVFTIGGERKPENIEDWEFVRDKFFSIEPDATERPISQVRVWRDDGIGSNNEGTNQFTASGFGQTAGFHHNGSWNQLTAGIDYTLNLTTSELELLTFLTPKSSIAVEYVSTTRSFGNNLGNNPRLIRIATDTTSSEARTAFRTAHELRNRYQLQRSRIKKDDPNFVFEIRDELGFTQTEEIGGVPRTYLELFGFDRDGNDEIDVELIDYDFGLIRPSETAPFALTGDPEVDNVKLYNKQNVTVQDKKYTIHIEYVTDQPQEIFVLGFDVLENSDIVTVDGVKAVRNADYFIDYEAGIITFLNRALLKPQSVIRVDYEFLPFGGDFARTLVGGRLNVDVNQHFSFGSTLLYDFSPEAKSVPSIFEDLPNKNAVIELDARASLAPLFFRFFGEDADEQTLLGKARKNFRLDLGGEWAGATQDPNTFGTALIDDFEEIEEIVSASFSRVSWAPASPPPQLATSQAARGIVSFQELDNFGHLSPDKVVSGERQRSLEINMSFAAGETYVTIRQPLSASGLDFSNMNSVEYFISNLPPDISVTIDAGIISEDADEDGILDHEDVGLDGIDNTGDVGERNGVLNTGEDIGIVLNHPVRGPVRFGAGDGALTTEDMDADFNLNFDEAFFRFDDATPEAETKTIVGADNSQWTFYRAPWQNGDDFGPADSRVIKHVRLTFVRPPGADRSFTVLMDQLSFRGSRFEGASSDTNILVLPRNTVSDPNYVSPALTEVKPDEKARKEQALGLVWNLDAGESATIKQSFQKAAFLSDFNRLSFFLAGDNRGETFSLFLVSDPQNFIEIRKRIDFGSSIFDGVTPPVWRRIDVPLDPIRQATISNVLTAQDTTVLIPGNDFDIIIVGQPATGRSPSLSNINQLWLRIESEDNDSGEIWLNDIYVADPLEKTGMARKLDFSTGWGDLFSLAGSWRDVPSTYKGVGFINNTQTNTFDEISQNTKGLSWTLALHKILPASWDILLPYSGQWGKSTVSVDPNRVESSLKSTLGKTRNENMNHNLTLRIWKLPSISLAYSENSTAVNLLREDQIRENSSFSASSSYAYSFPKKLFGVVPTGEALSVNTSYGYTLLRNEADFATTSGVSDVNSRTANHNMSFSVNSNPISRLSLNYNFNTAFLDRKTLIPSERWEGITGRNHSVNSTLNLPKLLGFSPGLSFAGNYNENFYRATGGGELKDANLGGDFRINLGIDPSAWSKLLSFLTVRYNFGLSSNASYRAMDGGERFTDLFDDYVRERVFPWGSLQDIGIGVQDVTPFRASGSTNQNHSLSGEIKTFDWLQTSYSANFTTNEIAARSTLSSTDGINGTLNMRMDYNKAFPNSFIKFRSSYITAALSYGSTENAASQQDNITPNMSWNIQWTEALNTTFNLNYNWSMNTPALNPAQRSVATSLTPALNFTYFFDLPIPEVLENTRLGKLANIQKRVQLNGGFNAGFTETTVGGNTNQEQQRYGVNLSLGYRVSSNLEVTASTSGSLLQDAVQDQNDNFSLGGGARVEWRF